MMWTVISLITAFISILIIASRDISFREMLEQFKHAWQTAYSYLGSSLWLNIAEILVSAVMSLIAGILVIYASISIGHLFNKHRMLTSFGAFLCLNTIAQIITAIATTMILRITFNPLVRTEVTPLDPTFHSFMWCAIILSFLFAIAYYTITNLILSKRLNLE
ncbi:MAG: hypothetical protein GX184_06525 [Clostridiaceae bacterium]|nr:hypothetical protein [Clostridiaceae bacterium]